MYLLDTNACIHSLNNSSKSLARHLRQLNPSAVCLCSIVKAELLYGAYHSSRVSENLRVLDIFFNTFKSIPFDDLCADHYGMIRSELARTGTLIGPNDLMIAAVACAYNLILVTHNTREFSRVKDLALEDWEEAF